MSLIRLPHICFDARKTNSSQVLNFQNHELHCHANSTLRRDMEPDDRRLLPLESCQNHCFAYMMGIRYSTFGRVLISWAENVASQKLGRDYANADCDGSDTQHHDCYSLARFCLRGTKRPGGKPRATVGDRQPQLT